jgi:hypothetical protein
MRMIAQPLKIAHGQKMSRSVMIVVQVKVQVLVKVMVRPHLPVASVAAHGIVVLMQMDTRDTPEGTNISMNAMKARTYVKNMVGS